MMAHQRVSTTYARRPGRKSRTAPNNASAPSSPLGDMSPSTEDVTLSEMSRRMKKRSRQVSSGSRSDSFLKVNHGPLAKKLKQVSDPNIGPLSRSHELSSAAATPASVPNTPVLLNHAQSLLPLRTQRINDSLFETPFPTEDTIFKSYVMPLTEDRLSPVPMGKRMLSRTSSRNLKENRGRQKDKSLSLASPFSSRPGSRAPSPKKPSHTNRSRHSLYQKSRTLSSSALRQDRAVSSVRPSSTASLEDSIFDSSYASLSKHNNATTASAAHSHNRAASIPNVPSGLGNISPEDWLVPPKALSRSPPSYEDMEVDVFQAEHPSFYFDVPNCISTPSRNRQRPTSNEANRRANDPSKDTRLVRSSSMGGADTTSNIITSSPYQKRRRAVVHMSSDSIFSSALDFSAYISDDLVAQPQGFQRLAAENVISPALSNTHGGFPLPLDPAFSPAPVPNQAYPEASAFLPSTPSRRSTASRREVPISEKQQASQLLASRSLHGAESDDELYGMFDMLGLDEDPEWPKHAADDSGIGFGTTLRRRKRGDTIRASDFAHTSQSVPEVLSPIKFSSRSSHTDLLPPNTRRTRSGTVTLSTGKPQPGNNGQPMAGRSKVSRRPAGLPTIKMRIEEPLPQKASDEEDDELLIKHDTVWMEE